VHAFRQEWRVPRLALACGPAMSDLGADVCPRANRANGLKSKSNQRAFCRSGNRRPHHLTEPNSASVSAVAVSWPEYRLHLDKASRTSEESLGAVPEILFRSALPKAKSPRGRSLTTACRLFRREATFEALHELCAGEKKCSPDRTSGRGEGAGRRSRPQSQNKEPCWTAE